MADWAARPPADDFTMAIKFKNDKDIAKMRVAGRLAAEVLDMIGEYVVPGVSTEELDRRCNDYIRKVQKATPANVGYHGFPKTLCTSVNGVVCHGIPNEKEVLADGDIINIDVTVIKDGWHGDTSRMYFAGTPSPEAKRLVDTTFEAMMAGIRAVRPGAGVPAKYMRLVSPCQPSLITVTSMLMMSPSASTSCSLGMPWQTTPLTEVHRVLGKPW